jgi:hypothetical protein
MWHQGSSGADHGDEPADRDVQRVEAWRIGWFIRLGFCDADASELAGLSVDLRDGERLIRGGCPHRTARQILLPL